MSEVKAKPFSIVVAATRRGGVGLDGKPPAVLLDDSRRYCKITIGDGGNAVIMGRRTWESFPETRPLPKRKNIVLSRRSQFRAPGATVVASFEAALAECEQCAEVFVIGGAALYAEALKSPLCQKIYCTQILKEVRCDTFIPEIGPEYELASSEDPFTWKETTFQHLLYTRKSGPPLNGFLHSEKTAQPPLRENREERQYLDLVREVIERGAKTADRTGVGTLSSFGHAARYSLRGGAFPLLTTKKVFFRGVAEELLWMVRGCTDSKALSALGVTIWDDNGSREFLDKSGFKDRKEGDLGPVYGFQWRHFGAEYRDCAAEYKGEGVDQLAEIVAAIKKNPTSRRILMSAWNPPDVKKMALPPCHVLCQFRVADGELSCAMYQRSCDLGLGVPFNIASYALLTIMVAHVTGLKPGEFVHMMGDTHVYLTHVEALKTQLARTPSEFPTLRIKRNVTSIDGFALSDFELVGYNPQSPIKMEMAV